MAVNISTYDSYFIPKTLLTSGNLTVGATSTTLAISVATVIVVGDSSNDVNVTESPTHTFTVVAGNKGVSSYIMNGSANNSNIYTNRTSYGLSAGRVGQNEGACAFGSQAGDLNQGLYSIAMGVNTGQINQGNGSVAVGNDAGSSLQGNGSVAIGSYTAQANQSGRCVAIGAGAALVSQGNGSIAIGAESGENYQGARSVCIGDSSGSGIDAVSHMGIGAIAIGANAASAAAVPAYSIALGDSCAPPGAVGRLAIGANMEALASSANTGSNGAPPAQVAGYLIIEHNGTAYKCPLYNM